MKTFHNLYAKIATFDNLLLAAKNAQKGKRYQKSVAAFNLHLEEELLQLREELQSKSYQPGSYRSFMIYDPKERMISAAPYRDRVVHHALMNVTAPIFERTFISDTFANRKGKGVPFLGFKVFPRHRVVRKEKTRRYARFLRKKMALCKQGKLCPNQLEMGLNSWLGHVRFGMSRRLEYRLFWYLRGHRVNLHKHKSPSTWKSKRKPRKPKFWKNKKNTCGPTTSCITPNRCPWSAAKGCTYGMWTAKDT